MREMLNSEPALADWQEIGFLRLLLIVSFFYSQLFDSNDIFVFNSGLGCRGRGTTYGADPKVQVSFDLA